MNKLQGKDLINVGIFTAIYFVVMMAIAMLGFIPIFLPLLIVLVPLIGGIVMMLYYSKVQKFGMVSLTGLICGILMLLTGMGYWSIITGAVFGVLADLVLKSGDYKSAKKGIISHGVFSMWIIGNYIPIVATRDSYKSAGQKCFLPFRWGKAKNRLWICRRCGTGCICFGRAIFQP